ncbi:enoyl-CoA hydratase/isomerase family protein [Corynebacterium urealyticum]|uniref:enoyl-CoA hydratase/isomerase family protein n=1 Tax=Corynebacterium urealyticum TaxID=43771 RepID=UPI0011E63952|nr:enoyl-CoA hydratase/isomerase family protein [Corynebacterium urealyticum]QQB07847.1 enoyl-CoA hydratase/isomerase family protein [Corynebacterium urealyticum]TYR15671.1 enoyl-CoA hydratase/isomerase family protein [Corynebacterium urealyticum]TYR18006.1 enoyl-CoA hydratase/isomerase family protein [Corynebacterium urealyticum]
MTANFDRFTALKIEDRDGVFFIRLSRPEVKNAIDQTMVNELHEVCAHLEEQPQVAVIVGTDGIFASGADIAQLRERRRADALRGINNTIFHRIAQLPMPVIGAVDGYALGGGLELALAADFRLATGRAKFGQPETSLGIMAAAGGTWRLRAAVGEPLAREILLAGRILDGAEALSNQLVTALAEPDALEDEALALAERIGRQDPLAVRITKSVLAMPEGAHPQVDNLAQAILFESEAKFDRMQAFLDRKKKK